MAGPSEFTLELRPRARVDVIDVTQRLAEEAGDVLAAYRRALYCSHHTTAGYFEQALAARLEHRREHLARFVRAFGRIFPPGSSYRHDQLELRSELSEEQKKTEPLNADSHLTFIGSGLRNCVTYRNRPGEAVFLVDLDGVYRDVRRRRRTTVLAFDHEEVVDRVELEVPVSGHSIDSVNLRDRRHGLMERLEERVRRHGLDRGRVDLSLASGEQHSGLTVNEYETLLMRHDLAEVLKDPLRHVANRGRSALRNPLAIPGKTLRYASYDFVQVLNELFDQIGASDSLLERLVARALSFPANRFPHFLRLKRAVSLLVTDGGDGAGTLVQGTYQSPILVQWRKADGGRRRVVATLSRFR